MGGKGSGRKPKPKEPKPKSTHAEMIPCEWCKKMMYIGRHGSHKKYCSAACKQAAYHARKRAKVTA